VGSGETNGTLTVTATSKTDPNVKSNATVTVTTTPVKDVPDVADDGFGNGGRVLTPTQTGDTVNWVEVARNGNYSLIVRADYIRVYPNKIMNGNNVYDNPDWQISKFQSAVYKGSIPNNHINAWFNGNSSGEADKLADNARVRDFTVQSTAIHTPGTATSVGSLTNGFSKPTTYKSGIGNDVAFILSYGEAANFISNTYFQRINPANAESSPAAKANYAKIKIPDWKTVYYFMWLRSVGDVQSSTLKSMGSLEGSSRGSIITGRTFQEDITQSGGLLYPALWVEQAIFD